MNNRNPPASVLVVGIIFGIALLLPLWFPIVWNSYSPIKNYPFDDGLQLSFGLFLWALFLLSSVNWGGTSFWKEEQVKNSQLIYRLSLLPYPTLFLLVGISGTFIGIYFGLSELNPDKTIGTSELTGLIYGLTLSFTTSIAGIVATLFYRLLIPLLGTQKQDEVGATEVVDAINTMATKLDTFINDLQNEVTSGLTEALQALVTKLETVITDQLGEAFKELNASIVSLNRWVIEYRNEVNTLTEAYKNNLIGIEELREKAAAITSALEPLPEYMAGIEETLEKVNIPLKDFADLGTRAKEAVTHIEQNIIKASELTEKLSGAEQKMVELADTLNNNQNKLEASITETTQKQIEAFAEKLASVSEAFAKDYIPITEKLTKLLSALDIPGSTLDIPGEKNE